MIRLRTKLLLCGAAVAMAVLFFYNFDLRGVMTGKFQIGHGVTWEPREQPFFDKLLLLGGAASFIAFIVSLFIDLRRAR